MKTEKLIQQLEETICSDRLAPLSVEGFISEPPTLGGPRPDAQLELTLPGDRTVSFIVDAVPAATPKRLEERLNGFEESRLRETPLLLGIHYLTELTAEKLEAFGRSTAWVSAIDLSGNYFIATDGAVAIRMDRENQYPQSRGIKQIYRGKSSLVPRMLLTEPRIWDQVSEIKEAINNRGISISLSTVSKALTKLDEQLLIRKERGSIKVVEPKTILVNLQTAYEMPIVRRTKKLKLPSDPDKQKAILRSKLENWIWAGKSSGSVYTAAPPSEPRTIYTTDFLTKVGFDSFVEPRFYNCVLECIDQTPPFFDSKDKYPPRLQSYLELSQLGKREQDIAARIRSQILKPWD